MQNSNEASNVELRNHFLRWQCLIRQIAMRENGGRPSKGMTARVLTTEGVEVVGQMTTLIVPLESEESTTYFRHQIRKTNDPREIYEKGLSYLQATHFQYTTGFSDQVMALFSPGSGTAQRLLGLSRCLMEFQQFQQYYRLSCDVRAMSAASDDFEATLWHNRLFNPQLPDDVIVLGFSPDWNTAQTGTSG